MGGFSGFSAGFPPSPDGSERADLKDGSIIKHFKIIFTCLIEILKKYQSIKLKIKNNKMMANYCGSLKTSHMKGCVLGVCIAIKEKVLKIYLLFVPHNFYFPIQIPLATFFSLCIPNISF
jgi:hypothetical protein